MLAGVGAGDLALRRVAGIARGARLDLALGRAGEPLHSNDFLSLLVRSVQSTGEVPEELVGPLARSGELASADEVSAAVEQALHDLAHADNAVASEKLIQLTAQRTGNAVHKLLHEVHIPAPRARIAVASPELLARYEQVATRKLPAVIADVLGNQGATTKRREIARLRTQFERLRSQVGGASQLTDAQRQRAMGILRRARKLTREDFANVRTAAWRRLRRDPELASIEQELLEVGDVSSESAEGSVRVRTQSAAGRVSYEPMNLEHRVRRSDNPWLYNDVDNLLMTDAGQNQQYLETIRQYGSVWPTDDVEQFVVVHGLNDQGVDFAPDASLNRP
jgi:hypothetical protein